MFAEELAGNAGRKRAEANRAKRRQLQQKNTQQNTSATAVEAKTRSPGTPGAMAVSILGSSTTVMAASTVDTPQSSTTGTAKATVQSLSTQPNAALSSMTTATSSLSSAIACFPAAASSSALSGRSRQMTALERAEEQRVLRAAEAQQRKAAVHIQSFLRCCHSNLVLFQQNQQLLQQRLGDLQMLKDILKQKKGITYVPPPATTTSLVRILLYLAYRTGKGTGNKRMLRLEAQGKVQEFIQQMIQLSFLPSLRVNNSSNGDSNSSDMNPFHVWMESNEGRWRFKALIHLCMVAILNPKSTDESFSSCLELLREVTESETDTAGTKSNSSGVVHDSGDPVIFVRSLLNPKNPKFDLINPPSSSNQKDYHKNHNRGNDGMMAPIYDASTLWSVDFVATVRYYLLFLAVNGSMPIPPQAESLRQGCISDKARQRAGSLVEFAWKNQDCATVTERLVRFSTHVLTVPLLIWKLPASTLSFLLTSCSHPAIAIPPFFQMIDAVSKQFAAQVASLDAFLPSEDVPLTRCPATNTQCFLANLVQIGRLSSDVNGNSSTTIKFSSGRINFRWAQCYIDLLSVVLDAIPVRTFSTRESAVVWISDGEGHSTPIVLSAVVLDQCKSLFVDSYVRNLLSNAIDANRLDIEKVLQSKNDKDKETEQSLASEAGLSAISLAAKESRIDRNRSFWNSSKWARKVSKGVVGLLSSSGNSKGNGNLRDDDSGVLKDTSSQSRSLASGSGDEPDKASSSREDYTPELLLSLCTMFSVVLARWGGGGGRDEIGGKQVALTNHQRKENRADKATATSFPESFTLSLLNTICFSTQLVKATWCLIQNHDPTAAGVEAVYDPEKGQVPVRQLSCISSNSHMTTKQAATSPSTVATNRGASVLYMFTAALSHTLIVTDDVEIHDFDRPLPIHQIRRVIKVLKKLLYRACSLDGEPSGPASTYFGLALVSSSSRSFRDLYDRSSRRPLCLPKSWLEPGLLEKEIKACNTHADYVSLLSSAPVLRICPMLVSFKRRLLLFVKIVRTNREELQGVNSPNPFNPNPLKPARVAVINRGRILEDGLSTMNHLGSRMRERIAVHYVNEAGAKETGIDAGGLFKEFWTDLCAIAFDPNYALFQVTEGAGNCMYPSPMSSSAHGRDHIVLFEFLGRILGKALYEGITIQPRFAHFFLSFLRGDYNFLRMLPDLSTIDAQLYNNLMFLKTYDGDAADLCLTFTITKDDFGGTREIPLIPNGSNIEVTNLNKQRYIGLVAKYYVVDQIKEQSEAFTRGLWDVVDPNWLRLFNEPELQVLISGPSDGKIDVEDLRRHTRYAGGYTSIDRNVARFWKVFASLDANHQGALLRFVTSCERPPPLGFASLNPPFTIQRVGIMRDGDKLPSASTCFNILKLPTYSSDKVLRERLIYAIESGAGFELT
ncbi:hypothetical protein ACA910_003199 [Epithemia clementina (nom. ined.)]